MQQLSVQHIKQTLFSVMNSLFSRRDEFLSNPETAFTRKKKISFTLTMLFPMLAGSDNSATELLDLFDEEMLPLPSAMIQRRNQIKKKAFMELFSQFTDCINAYRTFDGYQLVACDGSRINLPYNPSDPDTFIQCIEGRKGINQLHMNALYDPLNDIFLDVILQGTYQLNEKDAYVSFLDKHALEPRKRIYLADRGYASYNIFAHAIHNRQKFLIRMPEHFAKGLCTNSKTWLDDSAVDREMIIHLGRRNTKEFRALENYHCIVKSGHYDFVAPGSNDTDCLKFAFLSLRLRKTPTNTSQQIFPKLSFLWIRSRSFIILAGAKKLPFAI